MRTGAIGVILALLSGCGGGDAGYCGDGVVARGEDCDRGADNGKPGIACDAACRSISIIIAHVQVSWTLLGKTGVPMYGGASCAAVGAESAHVVLKGPTTLDRTLPCLSYSKLFSADCPIGADGMETDCKKHLPEGDYQATVTLLDKDGGAVTQPSLTEQVTVRAGPPATLVADFEIADFLASYTGSLQLRTSWGNDGLRCGAANPPVAREALTLIATGQSQPAAGMTLAGTPLDGTPGACYEPTNSFPTEEAKDLQAGEYRLTIEGFTGNDPRPAYCAIVPVFVGPGPQNQVWSPLVPRAVPPDGGTPDGGVPCP